MRTRSVRGTRRARSWAGGLTAAAVALAGLAGAPVTAGATEPGEARTAGVSTGSTGVEGPTGVGASTGPTRGTWRLAPRAAGGYTVSWTSPARLPVGGARPEVLLDGRPLGATVVVGRQVRLVAPVPTRLDLARLDVRLSGRVLDAPPTYGPADLAPSVAPAPPAPGPVLPVDPRTPGPYETTASDYDLGAYDRGAMRRLERVGRIVAPQGAPGARPLVLFLHGRHSFCYLPKGAGPTDRDEYAWPCAAPLAPIPSHRGYEHTQRVLASQGFVTVSVSANGINAQDGRTPDGGADARADLVDRHLRAIAAGQVPGLVPATVDLDRVVLVGHSRGGEGVNRLVVRRPTDAPYAVAGTVLLAPTDFGRQAGPYVPSVTMLPTCDGDVSDLQGQLYTDVARDVVADDPALHSTVTVVGANHNYFNTEWTPATAVAPAFDDNGDRRGFCARTSPSRLSAAQQRRIGTAYVVGAARLFAEDDQALLPMFDGSAVRIASLGTADVRSHAVGGGRDVRALGAAVTATPRATPSGAAAAVRVCDGRGSRRAPACGAADVDWTSPHFADEWSGAVPARPAAVVRWAAAGQAAPLRLASPLDLQAAERLALRVIADSGGRGPRVALRVIDGAGATALAVPREDGRVAPLHRRPFQTTVQLAQQVSVDVADLAGVDLADIRSVEVVGRSATGRVWVLDVAGVPPVAAGLPARVDRRLPVVSLGSLRIDEGDRVSTAQVPVTLDSPPGGPVRLMATVMPLDPTEDSSGTGVPIVLAPGQVAATIPVRIPGNRLDDFDVRVAGVQVYPVSGAMPADWSGAVRVRDDDATPRLRMRPARPVAVEGGSLRWVVRWARRVNYDLQLGGSFVPGPGPRLTIGDLTRAERRRWDVLAPRFDDRPLAGRRFSVFTSVPRGRLRGIVELGVRRDDVAEPVERLTLRLRTFPRRGTLRSTAAVRDR